MLIRYLLFIIFILAKSNLAFSSTKISLLQVENPIFILDIYGQRNVLTKDSKLKNGDYLKSNVLPALLILNNKTKICLSSNSAFRLNILKKEQLKWLQKRFKLLRACQLQSN